MQKVLRELAPALRQLRVAGVTAADSEITVEGVAEALVLDASTYRIAARTFKCSLLVPCDGQRIRCEQEVTERAEGPYGGTVALPEGVS